MFLKPESRGESSPLDLRLFISSGDFPNLAKPVKISDMRRSSVATGIKKATRGRSTTGGLGLVEQAPALVEQVVEQLRAHIIDGDFRAGGELPPEASLCERLGVSRTVVREAMRSLRAQGLVEVSQGKRPRVRPVDPQTAIDGLSIMLRRSNASLLHLVELRLPLESEVAAIAARRRNDAQIAEMERSIIELREAPDLRSRAIADLRFHTVLAEATANPIFQLVLQTMLALQWESRLKTIKSSSAAVAADWHDRILNAVRRGDAALARQEMIGHVEAAHGDLLRTTTRDVPIGDLGAPKITL